MRRRALHQTEQSSVKIDCTVLSETLQFFIHRRDLDQARHIATGPYRNGHMRHRKPEDFIEFPVQPDPIDLVHVLPILQRDHEVEALSIRMLPMPKTFATSIMPMPRTS